MFSTIAAIAVGGATGALARHGVNVSSAHLWGTNFPWGTVIVNVVGSFIMGALIVKFAHMDGASQATRVFFTTGFLGAFTTFSTFSLDFATIWEREDTGVAMAYMLSSVILSVLALFAGLWVMRGLVA